MKITKTVALLLALAMMISLTACGTSGNTPTTTPAVESQANAEPAAETETSAEPAAETETSAEPAAETETSGEWTPSKDITFVVPYEAGGNSDIPARIFAKYMSKYTPVEVKVTNIEGAGGRTGAQQAMEMDKDGSVVLMQPVAYPMQYSLGVATFTYEDFEPIGQWLDSSLALVVNSSSGIENLEQFMQKAKDNAGQIKMGAVSGTLPLFAAMYLQKAGEVEFNIVDLSSAKAPELMSNRIDAYIDGFGAVKQYVDSGEFTCLALFSDKDIPGYEQLSNLGELGYSGYEYLKQAFGMWAPKGTPAEAVAYINGLIKQASEDPECVSELESVGFAPAYMTVEDYTTFMKNTYATFQEAAAGLVA